MVVVLRVIHVALPLLSGKCVQKILSHEIWSIDVPNKSKETKLIILEVLRPTLQAVLTTVESFALL